MSIEKSKLLLINSHQRTSGTSTDFSISLTNQTLLENVTGVSVKSISCENGFYNVDLNTNLIRYVDGDSSLTETVTLPIGQYNVERFMAAIEQEFLAQKGIVLTVTLGGDFKLTITSATKAIGWLTERSSPPLNNTAGDLMGITRETQPATGPQTMNSVVNLLGPQTIYILSNRIALGQGIYATSTGGRNTSLLDSFSVAGHEWGTLVHTRSQDLAIDGIIYPSPTTLRDIDIKLVGARGQQPLSMSESFHVEILLRVFYR